MCLILFVQRVKQFDYFQSIFVQGIKQFQCWFYLCKELNSLIALFILCESNNLTAWVTFVQGIKQFDCLGYFCARSQIVDYLNFVSIIFIVWFFSNKNSISQTFSLYNFRSNAVCFLPICSQCFMDTSFLLTFAWLRKLFCIIIYGYMASF